MKIQRIRVGWDHVMDLDEPGVCVFLPDREARVFADAASQNEALTEDELTEAEDMARQILAELKENA